jgi:2-dehydro-3-deoxyphosphogluconate aldolase/(4S)-4-hydroxy-2-oxoglutarate aldolase
MPLENDLARVLHSGIVAVVRATDGSRLVDVAEALLAGGVEAVEITFTVPGATRVLEHVAHRLEQRVLLGAGTVLDPETARAALLAGARFVVSPTFNRRVVRTGKRYGALCFPGALTPTEILTAWEAGADIVKVFPSELTGPGYLRAIRAPLPQVRLMPTGGVTLDNVAEFIHAGACALGVGGSLVESSAVANANFERITMLAKQFVAAVHAARANVENH